MQVLSDNEHAPENCASALKWKFRIAGVIMANLLPVGVIIPELGLLLISAYSIPLFLVDHLFNLHNYFVSDVGFLVPRAIGFLITVPFWSLVGYWAGGLAWRAEGKRQQAKQSLVYIIKRTFGTLFVLLSGMFIIGFGFNVIVTMMIHR
jgi:hypothetical protein